ncbi:MAG: cyclic nucleotide-binding domain-containing protein [Deltaproteobacteria bacterium]|nr:MAG: cyclic nucleotide-binding domain-containing protein [Deltaproteobacteria bacterium]
MPELLGLPIEDIRSIPLFRDLDDGELAAVAGLFARVDASAGEELFRIGDDANAMYVLTGGEVHLEPDDGEQFVLRPPCVIGELGALSGLKRNSRAVAGDGAQLWSADRGALLDLFAANPQLGVRFEKRLLDICADKIDRDQRRLQDMRGNLIRTQKAMKQMRDLILEAEDTPISGPLHDLLSTLIERNRRVNYRVSPPAAAAAFVRTDDGERAPVEEISRTHLSFRPAGDAPVPGERFSGVLALAGPEIPISGKVLRIYKGRVDIELDLLIDEYASALEGYLTRVQMLDFLV